MQSDPLRSWLSNPDANANPYSKSSWRDRYVYTDPKDILKAWVSDPDNDFRKIPKDLLKLVPDSVFNNKQLKTKEH